MKLFCFPYAGGSAAVYNNWKSLLNKSIDLIPVELAGRGKRIHESFYNDFSEVIEDVYSQISNEIEKESNYAFFGHSMGAKIAYELTQKIIKDGLPIPKHIFFSGRGAPYISGKDEKEYYKLPDDEFKKEIMKLGGTPKEFFEHPELLEVFLPLLKNDFKLSERSKKTDNIKALPFDITVFLGKDDELTPEQIDSWKKYTFKTCNIHFYNGGHFFINNKYKDVIKIINNKLQLENAPIFY